MPKKLTIPSLFNAGVFENRRATRWSCRFLDGHGVNRIVYQVLRDRFGVERGLLLEYEVPPALGHDEMQNVRYAVGISTTRSWHGKKWYWFTCPLIIDDRECREPTRELVLLPSSPYFACPSCLAAVEKMGYGKLRGSGSWFRRIARGETDIRVKSWEGPVLTRALDQQVQQKPVKSILQRGCPSCGHWIAGTYCPACGKLTNGKNVENHFKTLDLEPTADLNVDLLKQAYRLKVREYHPDLVSNMGAKIRALAEEEMRRINTAFEVLLSPESRLSHYHELKQIKGHVASN